MAAAALPLVVGEEAAQQGGGVLSSLVNAMMTPVFDDRKVTVVRKGNKTVTTSYGFAIPAIVPVGIVGIIAVWEFMNWIAQAINKGEQDIGDLFSLFNPATWIAIVDPKTGATVSAPPSFIAMLSQVMISALTPGSAMLSYFNTKLAKAVPE
jgi:hypothetical protein